MHTQRRQQRSLAASPTQLGLETQRLETRGLVVTHEGAAWLLVVWCHLRAGGLVPVVVPSLQRRPHMPDSSPAPSHGMPLHTCNNYTHSLCRGTHDWCGCLCQPLLTHAQGFLHAQGTNKLKPKPMLGDWVLCHVTNYRARVLLTVKKQTAVVK